ncbi:hypothetical protein K2X33_01505 [bacterium]|nr:hypothetical protein [bacterium]
MEALIWASYSINVIVLLPICAFLLMGSRRLVEVFGGDTTARQILLCMYLTLLTLSLYLLLTRNANLTVAWTVFSFQIVYKILSLLLIKNKRAPVYWFNLVIALFHSMTLAFNPLPH